MMSSTKEDVQDVPSTKMIETGHVGAVYDAKMNEYGTMLATCSEDQLIKIFEVNYLDESVQIAELRGHESPVFQVAWADPKFGEILASCSYNGKVIVWKEISGRWVNAFQWDRHVASVQSICWAPEEYGLILACASADTTISVLEYDPHNDVWHDRRVINAHAMGCSSVSWAPAVSRLDESAEEDLPVMPKRFVSGGNDRLVKIWKENETGSFELEHTLRGHNLWVRDVAWAPPTYTTVSTIASCGLDKKAIIWRTSNVEEGQWKGTEVGVFAVPLWHVSWSPDADLLVISGANNLITCWKENAENVWELAEDQPPPVAKDVKQ